MASKICSICGKTSSMGGFYVKLRGKFNPTKKKRRYPNLQWIRLPISKNGLAAGMRVLACTKCIKSFAKV